jgi:hypothetical protein
MIGLLLCEVDLPFVQSFFEGGQADIFRWVVGESAERPAIGGPPRD